MVDKSVHMQIKRLGLGEGREETGRGGSGIPYRWAESRVTTLYTFIHGTLLSPECLGTRYYCLCKVLTRRIAPVRAQPSCL